MLVGPPGKCPLGSCVNTTLVSVACGYRHEPVLKKLIHYNVGQIVYSPKYTTNLQ